MIVRERLSLTLFLYLNYAWYIEILILQFLNTLENHIFEYLKFVVPLKDRPVIK